MKYLINNFFLLYSKKEFHVIIYCWLCVEILQKTKYASDYFVMHLSSFFGALVFFYLIDFNKKSKWLKVTPIIIEILHSIYFQGVVDVEDVLFSLLGIIFYYFVFQKKLKLNNINKK